MAQEIADSKLIDTWGSGGTKIEPDISKIIEGWQLGEQPPHEYMNWLQNTFGSKLNHILKNGVAKWNNETEYLAGASVQHSGNVWLCETTNTNSEPTELNANWEKVAINKDLTVTVDTIADLRSISYPANTVWASGYHTKNDGAFGSHIFRLKGVKTTETDNGGTVIIATIGGTDYVYELQYDGAINVKWFGAKGDGVTDDTTAIQAAIDFGEGKTVFFPEGIFYITSTLRVGTHTRLLGCSTVGFEETANKSYLKAEFSNTDSWVIDTKTKIIATDSYVAHDQQISSTQWDTNLITRQHSMYVENLHIQCVNKIYGGIRCVASPTSGFTNVGVVGSLFGMLVMCSWGVNVSNFFSKSYLVGFSASTFVNGLTLNGAYINRIGSDSISDTTRPDWMPKSEFNSSVGFAVDISTKTLGMMFYLARAITINSVITEYWDIGRYYNQTIGTDANIYVENNIYGAMALVKIYDTLTLSNMFEYTGSGYSYKGYILGSSANAAFDNMKALSRDNLNYSSNKIIIKSSDADENGWEYADATSFLNTSNQSIVRVSSSGSVTNIANSTTYTTLNEALRRISNSSIKKWTIILKDGETFTLNNSYSLNDKDIIFKKESTGNNPIIQPYSGTYIRGLEVFNNVSLQFVNVDITFNVSVASEVYNRGFIKTSDSSLIDIGFFNSVINLQSSWALIMQGYDDVSNIRSSFKNCTITGSSTSTIMAPASGNLHKSLVSNIQIGCSVSASVLALGTNGWQNATVLNSNFV